MDSSGIEQTRALAREYVGKAVDSIQGFEPGEAKQGLVDMANKVLERRK
jgi:hexaprenyl-diphosphate synthase